MGSALAHTTAASNIHANWKQWIAETLARHFISGPIVQERVCAMAGAISPCYNFAMVALRRTRVAVVFIVLLGSAVGLGVANAQKIPSPKVPEAIQAPANEEVVLVAHASGWQIYSCQSGAEGKFSWTLKAPDAELKDGKGNVIGSHFAGPSWKLKDGSEVMGKAAAHVDSDDPNSIPWLLVTAIRKAGDGLL